jgi:hypothetical protein
MMPTTLRGEHVTTDPRSGDWVIPPRLQRRVTLVELEVALAIGLTLAAPVLMLIARTLVGGPYGSRDVVTGPLGIPPGTLAIVLPVVMQIIGWLWIRRILRIEV